MFPDISNSTVIAYNVNYNGFEKALKLNSLPTVEQFSISLKGISLPCFSLKAEHMSANGQLLHWGFLGVQTVAPNSIRD